MMLKNILNNLVRLIENLVIDKNRLVVGFFILFFFVFCYFFKLDYIVLLSVTFLVIIELYKSKFINNFSDFLVVTFFVLMIPLNYLYQEIIYLLNFLIVILIIINILFPNFYLKKIFLISVLIFILNFFVLFYNDRNILYIIFCISFFNDTIAYISGKFLKGPLIVPFISPNKTWSGTTVSFILSFFLIYQLNFSILFSALLSISLFFGDIFFSYIKRKNKLKDFSNILHNHGGILDRLDSMFFFSIILIYNLI